MSAIHTIQSRQRQHDMPRVTSSAVRAVVSSLRIHQWTRNSLLFAAIVFAGEITDLPKLATAIAGCAGLMTYVLYTLSPWVLVRNGSFALSLTLPTALYGIFRFLYLVHRRDEGGEPSRLFVTDTGLLINGVV
ncbi:MAG: hypothetical protein MK102_18745 [Fuerstiella sp.]|nr:hypothetical protein [Fuerstiella sp.]